MGRIAQETIIRVLDEVDILEVIMHRPDADSEQLGDLLVQRAPAKMGHHLVLAWRQVRQGGAARLSGQELNLILEVLPYQARQIGGNWPRLALGPGTGGLLQQMQHPARRRAVQEIAVQTAGGGVEQLFAVLEGGERHHRAVGKPLLETGVQFLAGEPRQAAVYQQQPRRVRLAKRVQRA